MKDQPWMELSSEDKVSLLKGLGIIYAAKKQMDVAAQKFEKALELDPYDKMISGMLDNIRRWEQIDDGMTWPGTEIPFGVYVWKDAFIEILELKDAQFREFSGRYEQDIRAGKKTLLKDPASGKLIRWVGGSHLKS